MDWQVVFRVSCYVNEEEKRRIEDDRGLMGEPKCGTPFSYKS